MRCALLTILLFGLSSAFAHNVAVDITVNVRDARLEAQLQGPAGEPISRAVLDYALISQGGQIRSGRLEESSMDGIYRAALGQVEAGRYTLRLTDTTFPNETLTAQTELVFPLTAPALLQIPASSAGPDATLVIVLALAPVALSLIAVVVVLALRPKVGSVPANSSEPPSSA
jgi:hypothetical protein